MMMNRRQFTKRAALTVITAGAGGMAFRCGAEKVSRYAQTISGFLSEISTLLPAQAARISRIAKVVSDFDAAYRRGDFNSAAAFFNTMRDNIKTLTDDLVITISDQGKTWLIIISAAVRSIAVLLENEGVTQPAAVANTTGKTQVEAVNNVRSLANPSAINRALAAVRL